MYGRVDILYNDNMSFRAEPMWLLNRIRKYISGQPTGLPEMLVAVPVPSLFNGAWLKSLHRSSAYGEPVVS